MHTPASDPNSTRLSVDHGAGATWRAFGSNPCRSLPARKSLGEAPCRKADGRKERGRRTAEDAGLADTASYGAARRRWRAN